MVHAIQSLKCEKGHTNLIMTFDSNECGCHHDGNPCLSIGCRDCFEEILKSKEVPDSSPKDIIIPLSQEALVEIKKLLK